MIDSPPTATFVWSMILLMGVITFFLRFAPLALLARIDLPRWLTRSLRFVPPAVMAAIIAPPLFFAGRTPTIDADLSRIVAALLAVFVAWLTRSTLITVVSGMIALWTLRLLLGS